MPDHLRPNSLSPERMELADHLDVLGEALFALSADTHEQRERSVGHLADTEDLHLRRLRNHLGEVARDVANFVDRLLPS